MSDLLLIICAILPALILAVFIFKKDRVEKEPIGLLFLLLVAGVFVCFPAAELENIFESFLYKIFTPFGTLEDGRLYLGSFAYNISQLFDAFFGVALIEEGLKWCALLLITRNDKNFNCLFDGIVYSVFVSLGFAGYENVLYVMNGGFANAVGRAFTAVPGHFFNAVLMGFFYSWWKIYCAADKFEFRYRFDCIKNNKTVGADRINPKKYLFLSILVPVATHGLYDYCLFVESYISMLVFYALIIGLYVYCFRKIRRVSRQDADIESLALYTFLKLYPEATPEDCSVNIPAFSDIEIPTFKLHSDSSYSDSQVRIYKFPNNDEYIGAVADDKPHGHGTYYFFEGAKYDGSFENGMFNGFGTFVDADGNCYVGFWKDNLCHGDGTYIEADGSYISGLWEKGELVRSYSL